jgi:hypothetical protein
MLKKAVLLAGLLLCACDTACDDANSSYRRHMSTHRLEGFTECYKLCGSKPVEVKWDVGTGILTSCRCDYVVTSDDVEAQ